MIKQYTYRAIGASPYRTRPSETRDGIKMGKRWELTSGEWMDDDLSRRGQVRAREILASAFAGARPSPRNQR